MSVLIEPITSPARPLVDVRIAYALAVLLAADPETFEVPAWLSYGEDPPDAGPHVHIHASSFFGAAYGTPGTLPQLPLDTIENTPLLFGESRVEEIDGVLVAHADIVASAYFLLTRYEEWVRQDERDRHGRFPGHASLPVRAGFIRRPVVDEYARLLRNWAERIGVTLPPPRRTFSVLLTHDIDTIGPPGGLVDAMRSFASGVLGRSPFDEAFHDATWAAVATAPHPCDNLTDLVRIDERLTRLYGADRCEVVYFVLPAIDQAPRGGDRLRRRLQPVSRSGAAIGLHASYEAGGDPERLAFERRDLESVIAAPVDKNRHHFLRWREPQHGHAIAAAGIRWDSTLGYADAPGFRLGVCRPVRLFDPVGRVLLALEEHPLIVMDVTLHRDMYMNLDEEGAFELVRQLADATFEHDGEFVVLWHNTTLASNDKSYHRRLYPRVLDYLASLLERTSSRHLETL